MGWDIALWVLIGIVLLIGVLSILVNVYLLLGFLFPILNLETERKIRKIFLGKSSPIVINPRSYILERNVRMMMRVGWVTFLSAMALCLIIFVIVNLG